MIKRIVQIFKKDAKHLCPQILAFVATLVVFACEDRTYVGRNRGGPIQFTYLLYALLPLSCWLLVTSLMQAEKTVGHDQYWLTRPFSRTDLLAAKALFLSAFVILPVFVCQAVVLDVNGSSPGDYLGKLLVKQIFFTALLLLPMAAIATVTRNLAHAFLGGLLLSVALVAAAVEVTDLLRGSRWGDLAWIRQTVVALLALFAMVAVILLQFTRRRTQMSRAILTCSAVLVMLIWTVPLRQPALAIQSWVSSRKFAPGSVRIALDSARVITRTVQGESPSRFTIRVPIRLEDAPAGLMPVVNWESLESPWRSSWTFYLGSLSRNPGEIELVLSAPRENFDRLKNAPVRLRGSLELTLNDERPRASETRGCRIKDDLAPFPTSPWFGPFTTCDVAEGTLVRVAYIQRSFDLGPLRLADAVVVP